MPLFRDAFLQVMDISDSGILLARAFVPRCLVDGQLDDATSTFISPRPRQDVLQFAVDAFKFAGDSSNLVNPS